MRRSLSSLSQQYSVSSGKPYGNNFSASLVQLKYCSNYWCTKNLLERIGVTLKEGEIDKGVPCGKGLFLYNAAQTSDQEKVESMSGKMHPAFFLTGTRLLTKDERPIVEKGPNLWLTECQVKALGVNLKRNAKPVVDVRDQKCYPLEHILESPELQKSTCALHVDLNGYPYSGTKLLSLLRDTLMKKFCRQTWMTEKEIKHRGLQIREKQQPTLVYDNVQELYNVDQLVDPSAITVLAENFQRLQIYGPSGKYFPLSIADQLAKVIRDNPSYSRFWVHYSLAKKNGSLLSREHATTVTNTDGKKSFLVNATQLKPGLIEKYISNHKERVQLMRTSTDEEHVRNNP